MTTRARRRQRHRKAKRRRKILKLSDALSVSVQRTHPGLLVFYEMIAEVVDPDPSTVTMTEALRRQEEMSWEFKV